MADSRYLTYFFVIVVGMIYSFSNFFVTVEGLDYQVQEENEFTSSQLSNSVAGADFVSTYIKLFFLQGTYRFGYFKASLTRHFFIFG